MSWVYLTVAVLGAGALVATTLSQTVRYSRPLNWLRLRVNRLRYHGGLVPLRGLHRKPRRLKRDPDDGFDWDDSARENRARPGKTGPVPYHMVSSVPPPSRPYLDVARERLDPKAALLPLPGWMEYVGGEPVTPWHAPNARAQVWTPRARAFASAPPCGTCGAVHVPDAAPNGCNRLDLPGAAVARGHRAETPGSAGAVPGRVGETPPWVRELLTCPIGSVALVAQVQLQELRWAS